MAKFLLELVSPDELQKMHDTSIRILEQIGMKVHSEEVLAIIGGQEGISVNRDNGVVRFSEKAIMEAVDKTPDTFSIYGRGDLPSSKVTFGKGELYAQAIPGELYWVEPREASRREGRWEDFNKSVLVADALPNIAIVGSMVQPAEVPIEVQDIHLHAELAKRTVKPIRSWIYNRKSARYIIELFKVLAGGSSELRKRPLTIYAVEPITPLQLSNEALEVTLEFINAGIPVSIGPIPQAMATGPVTKAGNVSLGNAEILGTLTIIQTIVPGAPVMYYNNTSTLDPRTMNLVDTSPEQCLMGVATVELAKRYKMPAGVNFGLSDSKTPDGQAGMEKGITAILGALAGVDLFGGMGISGIDQGFSLPQLIFDDEIIGFVKKFRKGMRIDEETLAYEAIERVGIGGNFLVDDHTLTHWRDEIWIPRLFDRDNWGVWTSAGAKTLLDRAIDLQEEILDENTLKWLDEDKQRELDKIVASAEREILKK